MLLTPFLLCFYFLTQTQYLTIAVSLIITMGFCLWPILKDYAAFERAMRGEIEAKDVGTFSKNLVNNVFG